MQSSSRLALGTALAALALLAAGCGADDKPVAATVRPTPTATLSAVAPGTVVDKTAFVNSLLEAIDGTDSVHLVIDAVGMGSGQADVSYGGGDTTIEAKGEVSGRGPTQFLISGGIVYIRQGTEDKYAMIDRKDPNYGALLSTFTDIGPHESVAGLGKGTKSVTREATRTVNGKDIAVYKVLVDPTKATGAFKALAGTSGISQLITFTFEVGPDSLLRRITAKAGGVTSTVDLSRWGAPISIDIPSGDQLITPLS